MDEKKIAESSNFAEIEQKKIIGEIVKTRQEQKISQRKLSELSGVKQPIIARMESGHTTPQLETVLKTLYPLDKTLAVVPNESAKGGVES